MKTKNIIGTLWLTAILLFGNMAMISCVKDGEETIALEEGTATKLILGSWKVDRSELLDLITEKYHSDLPNDDNLF